ncbi:MAG: DUF3103 family protein [Bacteroidetes bacterium]|nr:DUF3103 family protein [Bacteroidota bacterium]
MPVNIESWNEYNYIPKVAFHSGFSENYIITAYDVDGGIHSMDPEVEPTVAVVVVGHNERVDEEGNVYPEIIDAIAAGISSTNSTEKGEINTLSLKQNNHSETLLRINCPKLSNIEPWSLGSPEIWLIVTSSKGTRLLKHFFDPKRAEIDNKNYIVDRFQFTWNHSSIGEFVNFSWYEEDWGTSKIEVKFSLKYKLVTAEIKYDIKNNDDKMGEQIITLDDQLTQEYNTGLIKWRQKS